MKKITKLLLGLTLVVSLTACGSKSSKDEGKGSTKESATPTVTYNLTDGTERTAADLQKMFDYWTEGFDDTAVADVTAEGQFFFQDLDSDGKATDADNVLLVFLDKSNVPMGVSAAIDGDSITSAGLPEKDSYVKVKGVWQHNPDSQDMSDWRLYVTSVEVKDYPAAQ